MTYREVRMTRREAFRAAVIEAIKMVLPVVVVGPIVGGLFLNYVVIGDIPPLFYRSMAVTLGAFTLLFFVMNAFGSYMSNRSQPTRGQVEERERALAKMLLERYPDLRNG